MEKKPSNNILDVSLFKRLMVFVKPYRKTFAFVLLAAVFLSGFSTLSPYLLKITIDDYITVKDYEGMLVLIALMGATLIMEVIFQFMFIYYANWLGQQFYSQNERRRYKNIYFACKKSNVNGTFS